MCYNGIELQYTLSNIFTSFSGMGKKRRMTAWQFKDLLAGHILHYTSSVQIFGFQKRNHLVPAPPPIPGSVYQDIGFVGRLR